MPAAGAARPPRLLILLPADGHGGCEYNALSFGKFAARTLGLDVAVSFPRTATTAMLADLAAANGLPWRQLDATFGQDDDEARFSDQRRATLAVLEAEPPDVVFAAMPWPARGGGVVAACAEAGLPTLVKFALVPETLHGPPAAVIEAWRRSLAAGQVWFANSRYSASLVERHFGLPAGAVDHFHVGPIGLVDLVGAVRETAGGSLEERSDVRAEFAVPEDALLAVTVARLSSQKGYDTLLEAIGLLADRPDLHFLWIGEGEMRAQLEAGIAERGLAGRVRLAGFRSDVRRLLRAGDMFVLPTVYEGGCSQALLEAMEEGLPIVVSRTSAVTEVVRDGEHALLTPVGAAADIAAAIRRLAADPPLRRRIGAAATGRARAFSRDVMFKHTLLRIDRLLATDLADHAALAGVRLVPSEFSSSGDDDNIAAGSDWRQGRIGKILARLTRFR